MLGFITFGRVLFAVLFIYTGATKLFGIQATADIIAAKVSVPEALATYTAQLESLTSMTTPQLLAIAIGVIAPVLVPLWGLAVGAAAALLGAFMLVLRSQSAGVMAQAALAAKLANEASGEIFQSASNAMFDL